MRDLLAIDYKKLKEEDRRFLLQKNSSEIIATHQGDMHNTALGLSLFALAISGFSLVYQTKNLWIVMVYTVVTILGVVYFLVRYNVAKSNLNSEIKILKLNYDEMFRYHFNYVTTEIGKKYVKK